MTKVEVGKARPTSHSYFSQRLKLHYLDWGNEAAEPVLLVHGVQDHCHNWDWTSEILCQNYHVVVPDLRGHGDSQWATGSGYNNLDYVYDIAQLVEQSEMNNIHLIGHSMGGTIASLFAGLYPEKVASLISIEGVGGFWHLMQQDVHPGVKVREWISDMRGLAHRSPRRYDTLEDAFHRMQQSNPPVGGTGRSTRVPLLPAHVLGGDQSRPPPGRQAFLSSPVRPLAQGAGCDLPRYI